MATDLSTLSLWSATGGDGGGGGGTEYLRPTDIATSFSSASLNTQVAGALASFQSFAPKSAVADETNTSIYEADCVFDIDTTKSVYYSFRFFAEAKFNNPLSADLYGSMLTEELYIGYQTIVTQTVRRYSTQATVFRRVGTLTGEGSFAVHTNRASIAWRRWYPLDCPPMSVPLESDITSGNISFSISGGVMSVQFRDIALSESLYDSSGAVALTKALPQVPMKSLAQFYESVGTTTTGNTPLLVQVRKDVSTGSSTGELYAYKPSDYTHLFYGTILVPLGY